MRRVQSLSHWLARSAVVGVLMAPALVGAQDDEDVVLEPGEERDGEALTVEPVFLPEPAELLDSDGETSVIPGVQIQTSTEILMYDNRDFRLLDETSDQSVIDTDDRTTFGHSDVTATIGYRPIQQIRFDFQAKFDVLWRDDQTNRQAGSTGSLSIFQLGFTFDAVDEDGVGVSFRFGRQPFNIGGVPHDYMLEGTLDALTTTVDLRTYGRLRVLVIDFFAGNDLPEVGYQFYLSGRQAPFGQRGETNTFRSGVVYELLPEALGIGLTAKAYYFFATIGGGSISDTGSDISYGGLNGNFRDRDYQHMMGVRTNYEHEFENGTTAQVYGEFSRSEGIDRKELVARDVDTSGNAFGGGVAASIVLPSRMNLSVGGAFYHFDGANFAGDGLEFERGFVGFRGARIGGLAIGRNSAWRPSAHMDSNGLRHAPHEKSRAAGTQFIRASLAFSFADTTLAANYWLYTDTSSTFLAFDANGRANPTVTPPFGYTREEFAAQRRNGLQLGSEIDLELRHTFFEMLTVFAGYARFMPSDFYAIEVGRVMAGDRTALGGSETFWAFRFGGMLRF